MKYALILLLVTSLGSRNLIALNWETSFESGLENWEIRTDLPHDPNNLGHPVRSYAEMSQEQNSHKEKSVKLFIDGSQDDGSIWLARYFYLLDKNKKYDVKLVFSVWSPDESWNQITYLPAYAGPQAPHRELDFAEKQWAYLEKGWKEYEFNFKGIVPDKLGRLWVAFGISVVWETEVTHYIDDLRITMTPTK